jgi:hypothetical protein
MSHYIRRYAAGGPFFFTAVTHGRRPLFSSSLARCPHRWRHSSFGRWVAEGYYSVDWRCDCSAGSAPEGDGVQCTPYDLHRTHSFIGPSLLLAWEVEWPVQLVAPVSIAANDMVF